MNNLSVEERNAKREKLEAAKKDYAEKSRALKAASDAATKKVNVSVAVGDLKYLMDNGYKMCFAKKVGDADYNVIWQSYDRFSEFNEFSWVPQYQIFRSNTFEAGVTVKTSSMPQDIGLGEVTTIDTYGVLSKPVTGGSETALNVINMYGATHIGINQISKGIDGKPGSNPIYVSQNESISGTASFEPVEKVMIWFECNAETSTMFSTMKSGFKEVDLTKNNEISIRYENGAWLVV